MCIMFIAFCALLFQSLTYFKCVLSLLDASKSDDDEVGPPSAKKTKRSSDTKSEGQCVLHVHNTV